MTINKYAEHDIWCEAYRPVTIDDYIGNEHIKEKINQYLQKEDIPHLLLYGPPGTGKTSCAKLITNTFGFETLYINASDENSVDTIREKIKSFVSTISFNKFKVVILDESDYVTINGQAALRNLMETFSKHARFILTCNYVDRIIPAIQSRCQVFQIVPPNKKDVAERMVKILHNEKITYDIKNVADVVSTYYPDIRRILNTCQLQSNKGELKVDKAIMIESDFRNKLVDALKGNDDKRNLYLKTRQMVLDNQMNDYTEMYTYLYDKVDDYAGGNTANIILAIAEAQAKDALVVDKEIVFASLLIQIINIIR
jgi:replication factor C small subunit